MPSGSAPELNPLLPSQTGLVEQKLFGRFTLKRVLGRGGMGVVWLAHDDELHRNVAMKFLPDMIVRDREAVNDLKRETRRSLDLTHHHIVRIYDFTQSEDSAAIIMEYVDGETLSAMKTQQPGGCFSVSTIAAWVAHFCEALDYAHRQALVVHRDLKPANLMVNSRGHLKVTDFGISRSMSDSMTRVSISNSAGTLAYMSPEQALGHPPAAGDDIYAFGATVYDLLTGRPPFFRGNIQVQLESVTAPPMADRRAELGNEAEPIPELWESVIASCLAKRAPDRPQSMREIIGLLGIDGAGSSSRGVFMPGSAGTNAGQFATEPTGVANTEEAITRSDSPSPSPKTTRPTNRNTGSALRPTSLSDALPGFGIERVATPPPAPRDTAPPVGLDEPTIASVPQSSATPMAEPPPEEMTLLDSSASIAPAPSAEDFAPEEVTIRDLTPEAVVADEVAAIASEVEASPAEAEAEVEATPEPANEEPAAVVEKAPVLVPEPAPVSNPAPVDTSISTASIAAESKPTIQPSNRPASKSWIPIVAIAGVAGAAGIWFALPRDKGIQSAPIVTATPTPVAITPQPVATPPPPVVATPQPAPATPPPATPPPVASIVESKLKQASDYLAKEQYDSATTRLREVQQLDPDNKDAAAMLDQIAKIKQEQAAMEARQKQIDALLEQAASAHEQKHWSDEVTALQSVLKLDPNHTAAKARLERAQSLMAATPTPQPPATPVPQPPPTPKITPQPRPVDPTPRPTTPKRTTPPPAPKATPKLTPKATPIPIQRPTQRPGGLGGGTHPGG